MLDGVIVVGIAVIITTLLSLTFGFFRTDKGALILKLIMLFAVGALNVANGIAFAGEAVTQAAVMGYLKDGLVLGAAASGIYGIGESAVKTGSAALAKRRKAKQNIK